MSSSDELGEFLSRNSYPYADSDGNGPDTAIDSSYFDDHCVVAIAGVFSDASYRAVVTDLCSDGTAMYIEASLSYGEPRGGRYYCRALSLYGIDKAIALPDITVY